MISRTDVYTYLQQNRAIFTQQLAIAKLNQHENAIHDMRVSIKRIRAIINFAYAATGTAPKLGHIKHLYKAAGTLRDSQVQQNLLKHYEAELQIQFPPYRKYLTHTHNKALKQFYSATDWPKATLEISALVDSLVLAFLPYTNDDLNEQATYYIDQLFGDINALLKQMDNEEIIHDIRKKLKAASYIMNIKKENGLTEAEHKARKDMKDLGEKLGDWHDGIVFLQNIRQLSAKTQQSKEAKALKNQIKSHTSQLISDIEVSITKQNQLLTTCRL